MTTAPKDSAIVEPWWRYAVHRWEVTEEREATTPSRWPFRAVEPSVLSNPAGGCGSELPQPPCPVRAYSNSVPPLRVR